MQSTTIEMLPVPLTDAEKIARGEELAIMLRDITSAEDAESERKKDAKAALEALEAKASRLAQIVRSGQEHRPIDLLARTEVVDLSWVEKGASPGMAEKPATKAPRKPQAKFSEAAE